MVPLHNGRKVVGLGFEIISKLDSYFLMTVQLLTLRYWDENATIFNHYFSLDILLTPIAVMGWFFHFITDLVIISVMKIKKFSYKCVQVYMCTRKTNISSLSFTPIH